MEKQMLPGLKTLFLVHFIVGLVFGLLYLLIPETFGSTVNLPIKDPQFARTVGAAVLGYAASSWWGYREAAWERVRIVVQMEIVWTTLGALVGLWGQLLGGMPAAGWLNVVILGGFAVAFANYYSKSTAGETTKGQAAPSHG